MPRFSVVIPTRARPDTLAHSLRTAVEQSYGDIEIIVHESGDDPRVTEVVAQAGDHRTRLVKTGQPVSMTENWERALAATAGDFVTFIGDDDGLLSMACAAAASVLDLHPSEILSWRPATYYWPQYVVAGNRNGLRAYLSHLDVVEEIPSEVTLQAFYHFREDYSRLPMIYNSFISRALVERVRAKSGSYFIGSGPDISSGIVNAFFSDTYLLSRYPLSVSGLSHHSTGHRYHFSGNASMAVAAAASAFDRLEIHPTLIRSKCLPLYIGNEMLLVKERLFPHAEPSFSHQNLLGAAVDWLASAPADYEANRADILEVARRNHVTLEATIPAGITTGTESPLPAPVAQGVSAVGDKSIAIDLDCSRMEIADIWGAIRLLETLLPPFGEPPVQARQIMRRIPAGSVQPVCVDFSYSGNGSVFLGYGWGDVEAWGVWTVGSRAELDLSFENFQRAAQVRIAGRMFVHARRPGASGRVLVNGQFVAGFSATQERPEVVLQFTLSPEVMRQRALIIEFEIEQPRSPAEDRISNDTRRLGFGLCTVTVTEASDANSAGIQAAANAESGEINVSS